MDKVHNLGPWKIASNDGNGLYRIENPAGYDCIVELRDAEPLIMRGYVIGAEIRPGGSVVVTTGYPTGRITTEIDHNGIRTTVIG